jgi:galactokinase
MDQSASLLCQAGHALLLDCRSLETEAVPFDPATAGTVLLVINTRAKHELTGGEYGNRRAECEEAARLLGVPSLRSVTDPQDADKLDDPVLRRRVRHIVTDNARVLAITRLLRSAVPNSSPASASATSDRSGNFGIAEAFREIGELLTEAHVSLRDDFEISWPEADVTVEVAVTAGALGARMMGGGFGGSVIALVSEQYAAAVRDSVSAAFEKRSWASPEFIDAVPSPSAHLLRRFLP